jgi:hypothetical protein
MKKCNCFAILFAGFGLIVSHAVAQSSHGASQCGMYPVALAERVNASSLIVEGRVRSSESLWDDAHHLIYTVYTVEVLAVLKGQTQAQYVHIVGQGGAVGLQMQKTTHAVELHEGETGVFTLIACRNAITKPYNLYEPYAAQQGFMQYQKEDRSVKGVFDNYQNIETDLYAKIQDFTHKTLQRKKKINWAAVNTTNHASEAAHSHGNHAQDGLQDDDMTTQNQIANRNNTTNTIAAATITSFSPTTVQGGIGTQLTITGTGFGATQSTSYVQFYDADTGGTSYLSPVATQYISWSNTQIVVEVPGDAGTGKIKVVVGGVSTISSNTLTVEYAIQNVNYTYSSVNKDYRGYLTGENNAGGYTFQMYTTFASNTSAATDFQNLIYQWRCATGINWVFGANTTTNVVSDDGINVVRFDSGSELATGILGQATSHFSGCVSGSVLTWYISGVDVSVDDGTSYFYGNTGSPSSSQYDFYTIMLHEMGHAHQLSHIIDNTKLMYYSLGKGVQRRTISTVESTGAANVLSVSTAAAYCSRNKHVDYTCSPTVTLSTAASTIAETSGSTTVTATLSKRSFSDVTVTLSLSGTATTTTDYTLSSTTITIPSGSLSANVTLASVSDLIDEANETVIIDVSTVTNGTESGTQQSTVTITDDDAAPTVTLSTSATSINETGGSATITATLNGTTSYIPVIITLGRSGTATNAADYALSTTTITIAAGATTGTATLTATSDATDETDETVIIDINTVTNGSESGTQQVTVTILDDDGPTVTLSYNNSSIGEAATSTSTFTATLSAASLQAVTVTLVASNTATYNADYSMSTLSIVIPAGSTTGTAILTVIPDALYEGNEYVTIDISTVSNGTENGTQQKTLTINDDDTAPSVTLTTSATSISETGGSAILTFTLSAASGLATTVTLARTGTATVTTDYTLNTTITIAAGSTSGSLTLAAVSDATDETDETVIVDISGVTNGTENGTQQVIVTIIDDDGPTVTLSTAATTIAEASGSTTITATLSAISPQDVTITLAFSGTATVTSDYTLATSIIVPAGSLSANTTLIAVEDTNYEGSETVIIDITAVANGSETGTQQKTVTITDNDAVPTVTLSAAATNIAEAAGTTTITATLSGTSYQTITVNLSLSGTATVNTDYTLGTSISISAGSLSANITLTGVDDAIDELDETVIIDISTLTNGTENGVQQTTVTITDDEGPTVTLSTSVTTIGEATASMTVTATLSATSVQDVTAYFVFSGTATFATDYSLATSLTIPAGSTTASLTLTIVNDVLDEANETIIIDIASVTNGTENGVQQKTITITDNDATPTLTVTASATAMSETGGSITLTYTLSAISGRTVTGTVTSGGTAVFGSSSSNGDYHLTGYPLSIPAGTQSVTLIVDANTDTVDETDETVTIAISASTNCTNATTTQTLTIIDDDGPTVTLAAAASTIAETSGSTTITATLSATSVQAVTVTLSKSGTATNATDYTLSSTTITIAAGNTTGTATLTSVSDAIYEGNETVIIDINTVTNGLESGTQQRTITITDDETLPTADLTTSSSTNLAETGGTASIVATLSGISATNLTLNFIINGTATNGTDYTLPTSLTIPAGSTTATATLTTISDTAVEGNETITIAAGSIAARGILAASLTFTIVDNASPLPVKLLYFTAEHKDCTDFIYFETAMEINNHHFEVETATDNNNNELKWTIIATLQPLGAQGGKYSMQHKSKIGNINYYRLKQIDYDGTTAYSNVVSVSNHCKITSNITAYPNPFVASLALNGLTSISNVILYDIKGVEVFAQSNIQNDTAFDTYNLPAGVYILKIMDTETQVVQTIKVIK